MMFREAFYNYETVKQDNHLFKNTVQDIIGRSKRYPDLLAIFLSYRATTNYLISNG